MSPRDDETPELDVEPTLEEMLEPAASRRQVADLSRKINRLMELLAARGIELESTPPTEDNSRGKKCSRDEASDNETPHAARLRANTGATEAEAIRYIAKSKEPNIPLPDAYDGNPKSLKKFLAELDLCFRAAPSKYAGDDVKVITAGR